MFTLRSPGKMKFLILVAILSIAITGCFGQQYSENIEYYDPGFQYYKQVLTYPDGSYFLRIVLYDQQREERGFYNNNGIWTVRGTVVWYNPERTNKHTETFESDDKGKRVSSKDEQEDRAPPLGSACASLCG